MRLDRTLAGLKGVVVGLGGCLECRRWYVSMVDLASINQCNQSGKALITYQVCLGMMVLLVAEDHSHTLLLVDPYTSSVPKMDRLMKVSLYLLVSSAHRPGWLLWRVPVARLL